MSISAPCAAAWGRAVAAALMVSVYAHSAEDGVECVGIGNEQEETVKALRRLLEKELGFHAENGGLSAWRVIAKRVECLRGRAGPERWRRQHESHVEKLAECREIRARENVPRFVQGRLLEFAEVRRCAA